MTTRTHAINVGEIEVTVLDDGRFVLPSAYFSNVPEGIDLADTVELGANLWVIRSGARLILVDTGSAEALKAMAPDTGQAWADVEALAPTDIVLTHMHADHLGGFLNADALGDVPIHIARSEWAFWTDAGLLDATPEDRRPMVQMIQAVARGIADRVVLHDGDDELAPGVTLVALPGHTPGHTGLRVQDRDAELLIISDAVISDALQCANPGITYALDGAPEHAVSTRKALLLDCAMRKVPLAATHFAFPGVGHIETDGQAFRFVPL